MIRKIWDVTIGHNYATSTVEAKDYKQAGDKVLKSWTKCDPIPIGERFISKVELVREIDS